MADHSTPGGVYTPIYSNDVFPPRNNPGSLYLSADYPRDVYTPRSSNASGVYPPPSINADDVYHQPSNFNDVYPPGKSNDFYPLPNGKTIHSYPLPTDEYPPPRKSTSVYTPPRTSHNGLPPGYHLYGTNNDSGSSRGVATGYPYVAQPPPPQEQRQSTFQPQNYYDQQPSQQHLPPPVYTSEKEGHGNFLRCLCSIIMILFIIAGATVFITWLVLRPRLPEFQVQSLSVKDFNVGDTSLSGKWDLTLKVKNPNSKMSMTFGSVKTELYYQKDTLADTSVPGFKEGKNAEKELKASFTAFNQTMIRSILDDIKGERKKVGSIAFNVRIKTELGFQAGIWKPKKRKIKIFCGDLLVSFTGGKSDYGSLTGPKKCRTGF